ncbi:MAG TPA: hypothetical protein VIR58_11395 [Acidimicrobiales bacterium]
MTDVAPEPSQPPVAHSRIVYLGPVSPHWRIDCTYGDTHVVDDFRRRVLARLVLLPPHDPQFRRNRERVIRDAERELIQLEWDLGLPEEEPAAS